MKQLNQLLSDLDITSIQDVYDLQNQSVDEINESDGGISALDLSIKAKGLMKALEGFIKQTSKLVLEEARKQTSEKNKMFERFGATIEISELGVKWHYEKTNDLELATLSMEAEELKEKIKARGRFLQSLTKPLKEVDEETGEETIIYPAFKTGTTGVKVSFGKEDND